MSMAWALTLAIALGAFAETTRWAVIVTGVFESSKFGAEHFDTGAGKTLFLVRLALAGLVVSESPAERFSLS